MASDQHFNVQRAVPFFYINKSRSCEFSFEVSQDDVGGEDADDAEVGSILKKSSNNIFKQIPRKDHFFGSLFESHK